MTVALGLESQRKEEQVLPAPVVATPVAPRWRTRRAVWAFAFTLLGLALVFAYVLTHRPSSTVSPNPVKSIAVLPFRPLNSDGGDEYLGLGEQEQALAWLEKAYAERNQFMILAKVEPDYDSLRADPRFQDLLRRLGLTP